MKIAILVSKYTPKRINRNIVFSCSTVVATLIQSAKLCDWKLIPHLERKKDKLDPIGELALERALYKLQQCRYGFLACKIEIVKS